MTFPIVIIILIGVMAKCAEGKLFSAIVHLNPLLQAHGSIIDNMEIYLSEETQRLDTIRSLLRNYKNHHEIMEMHPGYIENPLNAFTLIKRLTTDLDSMNFYASKSYSNFNKSVGSLPNVDDLKGAGSAIVRLQNCYELNVTELSQGVIKGNFSHGNRPFIEKVSPLSSSDLFELGRRAYADDYFQSAISWLLEALARFRTRPKDEVVNFRETDLMHLIRECYISLDDLNSWAEKFIDLDSDSAETKEYLDELIEDQLLEDFKENAQYTESDPYLGPPHGYTKYYNLCKGRTLPNAETEILHCYYKSGPEPFLHLARVKVGVLHQDPDVLIFYDVVSDEEIEYLKKRSIDKLIDSKVLGDGADNVIKSSTRNSKQTWFADDSPIVARISQRVADLTDLDLGTSENLQVANYGIGGHYVDHLDSYVRPSEMDTKYSNGIGDRLATVLFYMSDVDQGGATTFTNLELTVFPIKNAAIFWMNLLPSGVPDQRSWHGGCPVLRGSKWISTKWIHEVGQELIRPCPQENQN